MSGTTEIGKAAAERVRQQLAADARYDSLMGRVEAGESRNAGLLSEVVAAGAMAKAEESCAAR